LGPGAVCIRQALAEELDALVAADDAGLVGMQGEVEPTQPLLGDGESGPGLRLGLGE
jgi:hypothetical protein